MEHLPADIQTFKQPSDRLLQFNSASQVFRSLSELPSSLSTLALFNLFTQKQEKKGTSFFSASSISFYEHVQFYGYLRWGSHMLYLTSSSRGTVSSFVCSMDQTVLSIPLCGVGISCSLFTFGPEASKFLWTFFK